MEDSTGPAANRRGDTILRQLEAYGLHWTARCFISRSATMPMPLLE